jgi:N-methylhydantoinase A
VPTGLRLAADVGGTFTDVAMITAQGELRTCKLPSTPADYAGAIVEGVKTLLQGADAPVQPDEVLHASTVATNAILEGKGARTALVTTQGFRDVLELRRIRVPRLYEPLYEKPAPLVPRRRRFEVAERLDARGKVVTPLDETGLQALAAQLRECAVEAVAICFLHSHANPAHEQRAAGILRAALPGAFISVSSEVLPEIREYERTSTTVVNAYVGPVVSQYLGSLKARLKDEGVQSPLRMMQSSGGVLDIVQVMDRPATVVESGPAAGVVGAARFAALGGDADVITFDMGGTTAKASLIEAGKVSTTDEYEVGGGISLSSQLAKGGGYALKLPVIDVSEVGAGGGSIVRIDAGGGLKVGPDSAGADPGPVCYGRGGSEPTVTDASMALGYLNPEALAGGTVPVHAELALESFRRLGGRLDADPADVAHGVFRLANATMMRAVKAVSTYRGRDPRAYTLFAFGGNGGIHAAALAADIGISRVVIPPAAGVFSAVGLLCADREAVRSRAFLRSVDSDVISLALRTCAMLEQEVFATLGDGAGTRIRRVAEMRYAGQGFELPVNLDGIGTEVDAAARLRDRFTAEYRRTYGHDLGAHTVDFVALRVVGTVPSPGLPNGVRQAVSYRPPMAQRRAYFGRGQGWHETPVIARDGLDGAPRRGPLIVEEYEGTTVVPPGALASLDRSGSILITLGGGG